MEWQTKRRLDGRRQARQTYTLVYFRLELVWSLLGALDV